MTTHPALPIVMLDTGGRPPVGPPTGSDAMLFDSIQRLLTYIEAVDVRGGNVEAFDADGRPIALSAASDDGPITWSLGVEQHAAALQERLADHVRSIGPTRLGLLDADLRLDDLLRALWRFEHPDTPYPHVTLADAD